MKRKLARNSLEKLRGIAGEPADPPPASETVLLGKYSLVREIGRGATGTVYEGRDADLGRAVAVKILAEGAGNQESVRQRFYREARISAQLSHPNVVTVFDAAESEGRLLIVMEYVGGGTLSEVMNRKRGNLKHLMGLLEKVACGVQHAHGNGVIHRDLKPGNILMTETGEPKVADFGLAHLADSEMALTKTGMAVGTPLYMAPEQILGKPGAIDPRTDVYALGTILYEMLTGTPPFVGTTSAAVYSKVIHEEPKAPRRLNPRVTADMETICLKAIEKLPGRRYRTAEAFAGDLRRFLAGEAILAKPATLMTRIGKVLNRRKGWLIGVVSVGAIFLGMQIHFSGRLEEARAERRATDLKSLRDRASMALDAALSLRRAGDLSKMKSYGKELEALCRKAMAEMPGEAEPHYLWGRMLRALMRDAEALVEQDRALSMDPGHQPARYERIVLQAKAVSDRLMRFTSLEFGRFATGTGVEEDAAERWKIVLAGEPGLRALQLAVENDVRSLQGRTGSDSNDLHPSRQICARGFLGAMNGEMGEAVRDLEQALDLDPFLEEACEMLGTLENWSGRYESAARWSTRGLDKDRGYLPFLERRCLSFIRAGIQEAATGADPDSSYERGLKDADALIACAPDRVYGHQKRTEVLMNRANARARAGRSDALALYGEAVSALNRASELDPTDGTSHILAAGILSNRALAKLEAGGDTMSDLQDAMAAIDRALGGWPDHFDALFSAAGVWCIAGVCRVAAGQPPAGAWEKVLEFGERAAKAAPSSERPWLMKVMAHLKRMEEAVDRGGDPTGDAQDAFLDLEAAMKRNPSSHDAYLHLGETHRILGIWKRTQGQDDSEDLRKALTAVEFVRQKAPSRSDALQILGDIKAGLAESPRVPGQEALRFAKEAEEDLSNAMKLDPRNPVLRMALARLYLRLDEMEGRRGEGLSRARREMESAAADHPRNIEVLLLLASIGSLEAGVRGASASTQKQAFARSMNACDSVLKVNPECAGALWRRGFARAALAEFARAEGIDPLPEWRTALAEFDRAVAINPGDALAHRWRGVCRENTGRGVRGAEGILLIEGARDDYRRAMELRPSLRAGLEPALQGVENLLKSLGR